MSKNRDIATDLVYDVDIYGDHEPDQVRQELVAKIESALDAKDKDFNILESNYGIDVFK